MAQIASGTIEIVVSEELREIIETIKAEMYDLSERIQANTMIMDDMRNVLAMVSKDISSRQG